MRMMPRASHRACVWGAWSNCQKFYTAGLVRGVASNEAEEAVASSLFCARTRAHIGDIIQN